MKDLLYAYRHYALAVAGMLMIAGAWRLLGGGDGTTRVAGRDITAIRKPVETEPATLPKRLDRTPAPADRTQAGRPEFTRDHRPGNLRKPINRRGREKEMKRRLVPSS